MTSGDWPRDEGSGRVEIEISWGAIFRVLIGILIAAAAVVLWPLFKLLVLAILIAVSLYPIVNWTERRGWPRWTGLTISSGILLTVAVTFFVFLGPTLFKQMAASAQELPKFKEEVLSHLPASGWINGMIGNALGSGRMEEAKPLISKAVEFGTTAVLGVFNFGLILVMAIYLMSDGPRLLKWLIVFFPVGERPKISEALGEMRDLIVAYLVGQCITSGLAGVYVWVMLMILHVPMALLLGVVAAVFDVLPIIGFFLAVFPAMAMGLTVSSSTALLVFLLYGAYHLFENYFIIPKVYGNKLKLSTLGVLLAIMAAGLIAGVPGAIAVLPFVAAYPAIERLFLAHKLEPDTVRKHEQQKAREELAKAQ